MMGFFLTNRCLDLLFNSFFFSLITSDSLSTLRLMLTSPVDFVRELLEFGFMISTTASPLDLSEAFDSRFVSLAVLFRISDFLGVAGASLSGWFLALLLLAVFGMDF
jgi:hypothetical protein